MTLTLVDRSSSSRPWRSLELMCGQLMICTDGGCKLVGEADLVDVIALLPGLLARQDRDVRGLDWQRLSQNQRDGVSR